MFSHKFYKISLFTNVFAGYAAEKDNGNGKWVRTPPGEHNTTSHCNNIYSSSAEIDICNKLNIFDKIWLFQKE